MCRLPVRWQTTGAVGGAALVAATRCAYAAHVPCNHGLQPLTNLITRSCSRSCSRPHAGSGTGLDAADAAPGGWEVRPASEMTLAKALDYMG